LRLTRQDSKQILRNQRQAREMKKKRIQTKKGRKSRNMYPDKHGKAKAYNCKKARENIEDLDGTSALKDAGRAEKISITGGTRCGLKPCDLWKVRENRIQV